MTTPPSALASEIASADLPLAVGPAIRTAENPPAAIREMARILQPGGKLVITDLDTHDFAFLRDEQQDRWMGFARTDIAQWFTDAGLIDVSVTSAGSNCCADSACGTQRAEVSIFLAVGTQPVTCG